MATDEKKLSLKLLIDKKSNKVLYAEAGKDVVDFLFGLLSLPLGKVSSLLSKKGTVGCITALHRSLEKLDGSYIVSNQIKNTLLSPPNASSSQISNTNLLLLAPNPTAKFYKCNYSTHCNTASNEHGIKCTKCSSGTMTTEMQHITSSQTVNSSTAKGGCVKGVVTYSVMDDLTVVPMSTISSITLLNKFHIKDLTALEEKHVFLGFEEALGLLKASMQSKTVLTDVFLGIDKQEGRINCINLIN